MSGSQFVRDYNNLIIFSPAVENRKRDAAVPMRSCGLQWMLKQQILNIKAYKNTQEMTDPNGSLFLSTIQSCIIACGSHCQNDRSNSLP